VCLCHHGPSFPGPMVGSPPPRKSTHCSSPGPSVPYSPPAVGFQGKFSSGSQAVLPGPGLFRSNYGTHIRGHISLFPSAARYLSATSEVLPW
jgi:hypothetical protein